jgi:hypothetical protein
MQVEALSDLRGFSFFHSAREEYLRELCETVTGQPFSGSRAELEALCEHLKGDQELWKHLAVKGIDELSRYIVVTAFEINDLRRRMARILSDDDYDGDEEGMHDSISRLDKRLFDLVQRRNRLITDATTAGLTPNATHIEDCYSHKLLRVVMSRLRIVGCV